MEKIQGKFYRLQHAEWLRACHELQPSEKDVLYYIRTLDPYDKGIEVSVSKIADDLSTPKKKVHKSTVSRALKALNEKGFIDLELIQVRVKITVVSGQSAVPEDNAVPSTQQAKPEDNAVPSTQPVEPEGNTKRDEATENSTKQQSAPETPTTEEVCEPKINKTFKDFKDSLSVEEKETFEKFGLKMASDLPSPPQLPKKWIAKNWEEIRDKWLLSTKKPSEKQTHKWADHPQRTEWLEKINTLGFGAFIVENGDFDDERKEFVDWAFAAELVE